MYDKCVLLLVIWKIICINCQFFDYITIKIYRCDKPVTILRADTINNEKNVTEIIIEEELIPILKSGSFQDLPNLKYIFLQRNNIGFVEEYAFDNLPNLRRINLNFNNIKKITTNTFANLTAKKITLKGNGISEMESSSFYNLTFLHNLDLSSNNIVNLPRELFMMTPNLRVLDLSWNRLTSHLGLPSKYPFTYFEQPFWNIHKHEDSLINLSFNEIIYIDQTMFQGLSGVKKILLNYNNITKINERAFGKMSFLEEIELEGNNLEILNDSVLKVLRMTKQIKLANNPWSNGFVCKYEQWCRFFGKFNTIDLNCTYTN